MADGESLARECPSCIAMIICNEVIEDRWTNNKTLVGLFNSIGAPTLPAHHPRMFLMVSLTDGRGEWPFIIDIEAPDGERIFKAEGQVRFDSPFAVHDLVIQVQGLPLRQYGEYRVGVSCGAKPLASRRFTVSEPPRPPER